MKWTLATLNNLNRAYDFEFKHVRPNHEKIEDAVDLMVNELLAMVSQKTSDDSSSSSSSSPNNSAATKSTNELALVSSGGGAGALTTTTTSDSSNSSCYVQLLRERQHFAQNKPSLAKILSKTVCDITLSQLQEEDRRREDGPPTLSKKQDEFEKEEDLSNLPSDRSWEYSLPKTLRDRARELRLEFFNSTKRQEQIQQQQEQKPREKTQYEQSVVQTAYEAQSEKSDRDIINFLGAVLAVDFRHWISGTNGDEISKLDGCWCRSRKSPVLPCPCQMEAREDQDRAVEKDRKIFFEPNVKQMWNKDLKQDGKLVRGSMAMVTKMRDAVDIAKETDGNKYWFRPSVMIRRLLEEEDGRYEIIDDLFTGCDETGKNQLQFSAANARVNILKQLAEFYRDSGKDFYDILIESKRCLIGDASTNASSTNAEDETSSNIALARLQQEEFRSLPGFLPSLCRNFPRFYDIALFTRDHNKNDDNDSSKNEDSNSNNKKKKFTVAQRPQLYSGDGNVSPSKFSAPVSTLAVASPQRRRIAMGRPFTNQEEEKEITPEGKDQVPVLFMKLAQLLAVSIRSCRRLFCSKELRWLRDDESFLDEEENLTIASDYQIPNALRFGDMISYSEELQIDIDSRRILPATSLKEVEVRLVSVLAATALRLRFRERIDQILRNASLSYEDGDNNNNNNKLTAAQKSCLSVSKQVFTTSVLDYVIWLFGRSLTSSGLGCHHLTPGLMY